MVSLYENYYKLSMDPFRLGPDHRFSFGHKSYVKAKAYLEYALQRGEGFIAITGGPGTGKTTLINEVLAGINRASTHVATLSSANLEGQDLVQMVAASFGLPHKDASKTTLLLDIEAFLKQQSQKGHRAVLIVDEAQGLSPSAIEELRLLANLQHNNRLLLQVFLVGQETLRDRIREPEMEHLNQRIIAASHIDPLNLEDAINYIEHRLVKVGWQGVPEISGEALRLIHKFSGGVPRRINLLCSRLFLFGSVEGKRSLSAEDAQGVIGDLQEELLVVEDHRDPPKLWIEQGREENSASLSEIPQALRGYARGGSAQPASVGLIDQPAEIEPQVRSLRGTPKPVDTGADDLAADLRPGSRLDAADQDDESSLDWGVDRAFDRVPPRPRVHAKKQRHVGRLWWAGAALVAILAALGYVFSGSNGGRESAESDVAATTGDVRASAEVSDRETPANAHGPALEPVAGAESTENASSVAQQTVANIAVSEPGEEAAERTVNEDKQTDSGSVVVSSAQPERPSASMSSVPSTKPAAPAETTGTIVRLSPVKVQSSDDTGSNVAVQPDSSPTQPVVTDPEPQAIPDNAPLLTAELEHERLSQEARQRLQKQLAQAVPVATSPVPPPTGVSPERQLEPKLEPKPEPVPANPPVSVSKPAVVPQPVTPAIPVRNPVPVVKPSVPKTRAPVAVAKLAPPAPNTPVLSSSRVKAVLLDGRWNSRGKPASLLPSDVTLCKNENLRIVCWSVPQNINTKYGEALYKVEATLEDFADGGAFQLAYRTLVRLLNAENPEGTSVAEGGWQISEYSMSCRLFLGERVVCRDQKGVTREYHR